MRKIIIKGQAFRAVNVACGESAPERYAADQLIQYLEKIGIGVSGGAQIDLRIVAALPRDAVRIRIADGGLTLEGGNGRGVIYAVYTFLERYAGMRFFMPGLETLGEGDIEICEDYEFTPVFEMRQSDWRCGNGSLDWRLKNRVNRGEIPAEQGGGITYGGFVHTLGGLTGTAWEKQPCLSDPENLKKAIAGVREILRKDPAVSIISVSQNDNQNYCTCEKCAAVDKEEGSHAGTLLRFVNAVAADIAADHPDVVIDTLAYQYTRKAPERTKPLPNVCIRLCSIECCFSHPLDDGACPENRAFYEDIVAWSRLTNRIYIWDYVTDFCFYVPTFPNFGVLRENMRFFATHGVKGMYPEGNYNSPQSGEFGELRCYLLAKLMWDPLMDAAAYYRHMDEFLAAYYGAGWRYIRAYIDWTTCESRGRHMSIWAKPFDIIPEDRYAAMEETFNAWWDEAARLAGDRRAAVERSRLQWECIRLCLHPDADRAAAFLAALKENDIMWREWNAVPTKCELSASPAAWE